jgi:hypothetical protein
MLLLFGILPVKVCDSAPTAKVLQMDIWLLALAIAVTYLATIHRNKKD